MRQKIDKPPRDPAIAPIAARQHGVITRGQLNTLGLDDSAIRRRVRAGRLHRLHRNVYAVGHKRLTMHGRFVAAVLSCGEGAVLSHRSAAILWRLCPEGAPKIDVTVPKSSGRARRAGLVIHRSPLRPGDSTSRERVPVTTPARTIIDQADVLNRRELARTIDEADYLGLDLSSVRPLPGRRGRGLLAEVLAEHAPGSTRTKSDFEELVLALCEQHGLPRPEVNRMVEGYEVDMSWPESRLVAEADSWSAHGRRSAFERDRVRDADLQVAGWRVVRITWRRLEREPDVVARQLAELIEDGAASLRARGP